MLAQRLTDLGTAAGDDVQNARRQARFARTGQWSAASGQKKSPQLSAVSYQQKQSTKENCQGTRILVFPARLSFPTFL
jgi:hypothetical protein